MNVSPNSTGDIIVQSRCRQYLGLFLSFFSRSNLFYLLILAGFLAVGLGVQQLGVNAAFVPIAGILFAWINSLLSSGIQQYNSKLDEIAGSIEREESYLWSNIIFDCPPSHKNHRGQFYGAEDESLRFLSVPDKITRFLSTVSINHTVELAVLCKYLDRQSTLKARQLINDGIGQNFTIEYWRRACACLLRSYFHSLVNCWRSYYDRAGKKFIYYAGEDWSKKRRGVVDRHVESHKNEGKEISQITNVHRLLLAIFNMVSENSKFKSKDLRELKLFCFFAFLRIWFTTPPDFLLLKSLDAQRLFLFLKSGTGGFEEIGKYSNQQIEENFERSKRLALPEPVWKLRFYVYPPAISDGYETYFVDVHRFIYEAMRVLLPEEHVPTSIEQYKDDPDTTDQTVSEFYKLFGWMDRKNMEIVLNNKQKHEKEIKILENSIEESKLTACSFKITKKIKVKQNARTCEDPQCPLSIKMGHDETVASCEYCFKYCHANCKNSVDNKKIRKSFFCDCPTENAQNHKNHPEPVPEPEPEPNRDMNTDEKVDNKEQSAQTLLSSYGAEDLYLQLFKRSPDEKLDNEVKEA